MENSQSLGMKLVRSLTEQLGGIVSYRNQNGLQCDIRIARSRSKDGNNAISGGV